MICTLFIKIRLFSVYYDVWSVLEEIAGFLCETSEMKGQRGLHIPFLVHFGVRLKEAHSFVCLGGAFELQLERQSHRED